MGANVEVGLLADASENSNNNILLKKYTRETVFLSLPQYERAAVAALVLVEGLLLVPTQVERLPRKK